MLNLRGSDHTHSSESHNLPPDATCPLSGCMTLKGPLGPLKSGTIFGSFWPRPEQLASPRGSISVQQRPVPVPFWQMKPCVSSVQLRSSQRPVKWAEGLCRITAQLV